MPAFWCIMVLSLHVSPAALSISDIYQPAGLTIGIGLHIKNIGSTRFFFAEGRGPQFFVLKTVINLRGGLKLIRYIDYIPFVENATLYVTNYHLYFNLCTIVFYLCIDVRHSSINFILKTTWRDGISSKKSSVLFRPVAKGGPGGPCPLKCFWPPQELLAPIFGGPE